MLFLNPKYQIILNITNIANMYKMLLIVTKIFIISLLGDKMYGKTRNKLDIPNKIVPQPKYLNNGDLVFLKYIKLLIPNSIAMMPMANIGNVFDGILIITLIVYFIKKHYSTAMFFFGGQKTAQQ